MEAKISVIIPVYNVECYLHQCLDSVVNQTYKNLEILLIDDGSPDNCGTICDEYAANDERIKVIHKKNEGVHAAWNDGLKAATGEWVTFVDSDDWIELFLYEKLLSDPRASKSDLVIANGYFWEEERGGFVREAFLEETFLEGRTGHEWLNIHNLVRPKDARTKGSLSYIWSKLYRLSFLREKKIKFDPQIRTGMMGDLLFNFDVYEQAGTVLGLVICGYHYRVTNTSGTGKFDPERAKRQEYIEKEIFKRINNGIPSLKLQQAFESRCLRDIVHNLQRCYFHPNNPNGRKEIAKGIRHMKQMPYYKAAILSKNNPFNDIKLKAFQIALKFPCVWQLRMMITIWSILDKREKVT